MNLISLPDDQWLKSALKWSLLIIFAFSLQTQITIFAYPFNFIILIVYMYVLQTSRGVKKEEFHFGVWEIKSTVFGASVGILDDIISGSIIGPSFLSKGLIGFFGSVLFGSVFFRWTPMLGFIVVFVMTIFDALMQIVLRMIFSDIRIDLIEVSQMILLQALINLPFGLLLRPSENK